MTPAPLTARYTPTYSLIVLAATSALCAFVLWLVWGEGAGWSILTRNGHLSLQFSEGLVKLVLLTLLMVAVFVTQLWDFLRPQTILTVGHATIHDRRLTRGPVRFEQLQSIQVYRKGWQYVATLTLKPSTLDRVSSDLGFGPMPLYAFNRLCARLLKRPELNVHLGGLTVPENEILAWLHHFHGSLLVAEAA